MPALADELAARLQERPGQPFTLPGLSLRESAVLVPLFFDQGVPHLLLTKRVATLRSHGGQISFPGGMRDPEDLTSLHTALREMKEELGVDASQLRVLGMLDHSPTLTGFVIHPYLVELRWPTPLRPAPSEVDQLLQVPLSHLLQARNLRTEKRLVMEVEREIYFYDFPPHVIWGATAAILKNLLSLTADLPPMQALVTP